MDPVMQTLFGKMPIEQLNAVQSATIKSKNADTILIIGGIAIALGITAYILYKQNIELKRQIIIIKSKNQ